MDFVMCVGILFVLFVLYVIYTSFIYALRVIGILEDPEDYSKCK